jgi:hypothetical protein
VAIGRSAKRKEDRLELRLEPSHRRLLDGLLRPRGAAKLAADVGELLER